MIHLVPAHKSPEYDDHLRIQVGWLNDPGVMKYSEQRHVAHTIDSQRNYVFSFNGHNEVFREVHADGVFVGTMTAYLDLNNKVANLGIMIGDRRYQGKGIGKKAWITMSKALFLTGIRKIEAGCMDENKPMKSICLSTGMAEEGRRKDHFSLPGGYSDLVLFGKFK